MEIVITRYRTKARVISIYISWISSTRRDICIICYPSVFHLLFFHKRLSKLVGFDFQYTVDYIIYLVSIFVPETIETLYASFQGYDMHLRIRISSNPELHNFIQTSKKRKTCNDF